LDRCVDGDTADLLIDLGFHVTAKIRVRLLGVDTPERGEAMYKEATDTLRGLIEEVADEDGHFPVETHKTGKYGRWLAAIPGVTDKMAELWPYNY
jgi:micrococcal nuclease